MKSTSNTAPARAFEIENVQNGRCDITFFANVTWNEAHDECEYDVARLMQRPYRPTLAADIEAHYEAWLAAAVAEEAHNSQTQTTDAQRLEALESAMLELILGGSV